MPLELLILGAIAAAFFVGLAWGFVLHAQLSRYLAANRRGGELDLTPRRS